MAVDRGLTGRDVIAKAFTAKARKGYDPAEVDAYLEQVAAQIDSLHAEIGRVGAELEACQAEKAKLAAAPAPAPEPAVAAVAAPVAEVEEDVVEEVAVAKEAEIGPAQRLANEEAAEVILRMAQKASADAIGEARVRADEILAEAEVRAAEISRDGDRKAFEAASRLQNDLRELEGDIEQRNLDLERVQGTIIVEQHRLKQMADDLMELAGAYSPPEPVPASDDAEIIDLTASSGDNTDATTS